MSAVLVELPRYGTEKEFGDTGGERQKTGWISQQQDHDRLLMPTLDRCPLSWHRCEVRQVVYNYDQSLLSPQSNDESAIN